MNAACLHHLKNVARVIALVTFFFLGFRHAYADSCKERVHALGDLLKAGYAYVATLEAETGHVTQLYINPRTGAWKWIGVTTDVKFCTLMQGNVIYPAVERDG